MAENANQRVLREILRIRNGLMRLNSVEACCMAARFDALAEHLQDNKQSNRS